MSRVAPDDGERRRPRAGRSWLPAMFVAVPLLAATIVGVLVAADDPAESPVEPPELVAASRADLGAELFELQCSSCHGLDGRGVEDRGPSLETAGEAAADFVLRTGRMPIAAPGIQARRGPVRYSEEQIVALVEHVGSLGTGPDIPDVDTAAADVGNGGRLYRLNCAACHVASGAGAPIGSNRRAPNLLNSTATEIGEAMLVGPGAMPEFTSLSPDDFDDIAAYIEHLQEENTTAAVSFGGAGPAAEGLAAWLLALVPLIALTRWIGKPKEGRDRPVPDGDGVASPDPPDVDGAGAPPEHEGPGHGSDPDEPDEHGSEHDRREPVADVH